ncbi:MAG: oxidoreductase [Planctomycetes bacterium RBG_16_64_10]|nr:MAG: oxidoreductase [Planctomycetes bacterium RBG_16_64_10]
MGMIHYLSYEQTRGIKVAAVCELDPQRLAGDWRSIRGNFGPPGKEMDLTGISRYAQIDELIAAPDIELVDICLPPALHAEVAIRALQAGKHVFCEKPIALTAEDAKRMVSVAARAGRLLMIGHVLPFFPEYAYALDVVRTGRYGRLLGGTFRRVISDPQWLTGYYDPQKIGGPMLDLYVHDAHFIRLLCGMPRAVFTTGRMRGAVASWFTTQYQFADPALAVTATSGVIDQQGRTFTHGFEIHLEQATLLFDFAVIEGQPRQLMPLTVFDSAGRVQTPQLGSGDPVDAFQIELAAVATAIGSGAPADILRGELARDAVVMCHKQTQSLKTGRIVKL